MSVWSRAGALCIHPSRKPGAQIFEKEPNDSTRVSCAYEASGRGGAAPKSSRWYTSSATINRSCARLMATSASRRAADIVMPVGFWNDGMV